jgi:hypothetical protein
MLILIKGDLSLDTQKLARFINAGLGFETVAAAFGITVARLKQELEQPELKALIQERKEKQLDQMIATEESLEAAEKALIIGITRGALNPNESLSTRAAALKTIAALRDSRERNKPQQEAGNGKVGSVGLRLLVSTQIAAQLQITKTAENEIYEIGDMRLHPMSLANVQRLLDNELSPGNGPREIGVGSEEDRSTEETQG